MNRSQIIIIILLFPAGFCIGLFLASIANSRTKTPPPVVKQPTVILYGSNDTLKPKEWGRVQEEWLIRKYNFMRGLHYRSNLYHYGFTEIPFSIVHNYITVDSLYFFETRTKNIQNSN